MNALLDWLNSESVIIFIAGIMIISFAKAIIRIFEMGVMFKTKLATKQEQKEFEEKIRKDMIAYKQEIQSVVLDVVMRTINNELRQFEGTKKLAENLAKDKELILYKVEQAMEKFEEVKAMSDTVRNMNFKLQKIEYGKELPNERRSDK